MNRIAKYLERSEDASAIIQLKGDEWMEGLIQEPDFSAELGSLLRPPWTRQADDGEARSGGGTSSSSGKGQGEGRSSTWKPRLASKNGGQPHRRTGPTNRRLARRLAGNAARTPPRSLPLFPYRA
jgi:hypothetical protein